MTQSENQAWEKIRARGHARFILRHGVLLWGVPFGVVVTLGPFIYDVFTHHATSSIRSMVAAFAFLTLAFGYGMGETEWRRREKAYLEDRAP
jgi:hypothetical protein